MELNQLNNVSFSHTALSSNEQLKSKNVDGVDSISKPLKLDKIDVQGGTKSSFTNSLTSNITQISKSMSVQSTVSKQIDITNEIEKSIQKVMSNPNSEKSLDDIQPKIKSLMDSFNNYSSKLSTSISAISNNSTEEERSRMYFDGILGAKPLSSEEIFAEVNSQRERLQSVHKEANEEVLNNIEKSKEIINNQKRELETQQPEIKQIDFSLESSNFEPKKLQSVEGSVIDTQANAKVEQNIKLLAS
jgi:hypothetical protein